MAQELEVRVWNLELMVQLPPLASGKALSTSIDKKNIYNGFISVPPVILPLSFGQSVLNEGGFAQVSCIVTEGDEPLTIGWTFHGHTLSAALGIVTTPLGSRGSSLMIPSVGHKHRGNYTCKASNVAAVRTKSVELRVNGE